MVAHAFDPKCEGDCREEGHGLRLFLDKSQDCPLKIPKAKQGWGHSQSGGDPA
jgi:hypothetical protein